MDWPPPEEIPPGTWWQHYPPETWDTDADDLSAELARVLVPPAAAGVLAVAAGLGAAVYLRRRDWLRFGNRKPIFRP